MTTTTARPTWRERIASSRAKTDKFIDDTIENGGPKTDADYQRLVNGLAASDRTLDDVEQNFATRERAEELRVETKNIGAAEKRVIATRKATEEYQLGVTKRIEDIEAEGQRLHADHNRATAEHALIQRRFCELQRMEWENAAVLLVDLPDVNTFTPTRDNAQTNCGVSDPAQPYRRVPKTRCKLKHRQASPKRSAVSECRLAI